MGKPRLKEADLELWRLVAQSVVPLRSGPRPSSKASAADEKSKSAIAKGAAKAKGGAKAESTAKSADRPPPPKPAHSQHICSQPAQSNLQSLADMDRRQAQRFRRGQMAIEGKIDLHGHTQREAHDALLAFLRAAHRADRRALLVVTGKGSTGSQAGILKSMVPRWLAEPALRAIVLAIAPAHLRHGGEGALYVLLKRRREGRTN